MFAFGSLDADQEWVSLVLDGSIKMGYHDLALIDVPFLRHYNLCHTLLPARGSFHHSNELLKVSEYILRRTVDLDIVRADARTIDRVPIVLI